MRPIDRLIIVFLFFLSLLTAVYTTRLTDAYPALGTYAILFIALFLLTPVHRRNSSKVTEIACDIVFPVTAVLLIFNSLGGLVHNIHATTYDHVLIRFDYMLFGIHPTVALERFINPVITEFLQYAYMSYYFLPIIFGVALKMEGKETEFNKSVFLIILCFFLSYVGYLLFPAVGPRYTLHHLHSTELHGILLRDAIDDMLNTLEGMKQDAFPSGHTAVTLVITYLAYQFQRKLFRMFLPVSVALIISTVYLRYHYVIDVIAGIGLFVLTVFIGNAYYSWWERNNGITGSKEVRQ